MPVRLGCTPESIRIVTRRQLKSGWSIKRNVVRGFLTLMKSDIHVNLMAYSIGVEWHVLEDSPRVLQAPTYHLEGILRLRVTETANQTSQQYELQHPANPARLT